MDNKVLVIELQILFKTLICQKNSLATKSNLCMQDDDGTNRDAQQLYNWICACNLTEHLLDVQQNNLNS